MTDPVADPVPPLPPVPVYLPFEPGPHRAAMGLMACPPAALTLFDADYPAQMALRRELLASRPAEVFAALPGSAAMRAEALEVIVAHLLADRGGWFRRDGGVLENRLTGEAWVLAAPPCDPLEMAGRLVVEDICLLAPEMPARLVASVLCFPSRWRLAEKIGRELAAIHGEVPLYAERLERPVDRFIGLLKPGRLVERMNWSVHDDWALFQPEGHAAAALTAADAAAQLVLRVERQTLSRLPASGAVMFTIRTYQYALETVVSRGGAAGLLAAITGLPDSLAAYKGIGRFRAVLEEYLRRWA
ncbi:heme-dependent oxidative N-demethylase family protein [Acidiphilium sp.]|uniref:heme-dependent oxidative N-demethylase family protein n=1 Tax=Acidiphilium sp. TaxID=527 RepID=UPI003CFECAE0